MKASRAAAGRGAAYLLLLWPGLLAADVAANSVARACDATVPYPHHAIRQVCQLRYKRVSTEGSVHSLS